MVPEATGRKIRFEAFGIEFERAFEGGRGFVAAADYRQRLTVSGMGFGQIGIERQRLSSVGEDLRRRDCYSEHADQLGIAIGDPGISAGEAWIQHHRASEHLPR